MSVLGFLYSFISNISHSKKNWARCNINMMYIGVHVSTCYSCQILMKIELYRHMFENISDSLTTIMMKIKAFPRV